MATQMYGVRKFLNDAGYKDSDITYDPNRRMVQLQGKDFYGAAPDSDGSTYGTYNELSSALNNYRGQQRNSQLDSLVNTMNQRATAAQPFQYKAPTAFSYEPSADPRYQAALREAQSNTQTAAGNISADLNRRGIMNSTINTNLANQAAQKEYGHVSNDLLPQYYQQAYNQWADQANRDLQVQQANYGAQQDQFRNMNSVADFLQAMGQQDFNNQRQNRLDHINLANDLTNTYGVPVMPTDDAGQSYAQVAGKQPLNAVAQAFQQLVQMAGLTGQLPDGSSTYQAQQDTIRNNQANADEARLTDNARLDNLYRTWERTGVAPAGIPGVQEGTKLYDQVGSRQDNQTPTPKTTDYKTDPDFADDVSYIHSNPTTALDSLRKNSKAFIDKYGYEGYQALVKEASTYNNGG